MAGEPVAQAGDGRLLLAGLAAGEEEGTGEHRPRGGLERLLQNVDGVPRTFGGEQHLGLQRGRLRRVDARPALGEGERRRWIARLEVEVDEAVVGQDVARRLLADGRERGPGRRLVPGQVLATSER